MWRPGGSPAAGTALPQSTYKDVEPDRVHQAAGTQRWWAESGCCMAICACASPDLEGESDLCLDGFGSAGGDSGFSNTNPSVGISLKHFCL